MDAGTLAFAAVAFVFMVIFLATLAMLGKKDALEIWTKVYLPILGLLAAAWIGQTASQWLRG